MWHMREGLSKVYQVSSLINCMQLVIDYFQYSLALGSTLAPKSSIVKCLLPYSKTIWAVVIQLSDRNNVNVIML